MTDYSTDASTIKTALEAVYAKNNDSRLSDARIPLTTKIDVDSTHLKDLDDYTDHGFYFVSSDAKSVYVDNTPRSDGAFFLLVENWNETTTNYCKQTLTYWWFNETYIRIRSKNQGWSSWKEIATYNDTFTTKSFYDTDNWNVSPNVINTDELTFNDTTTHTFTFSNLPRQSWSISFDVIEAGGSIKVNSSEELNNDRTPMTVTITKDDSTNISVNTTEGYAYTMSSLSSLSILPDSNDSVKIRNLKLTSKLMQSQVDNKLELSDLQSLLQTWESYTLNTYATLYVNHTLRQCELYYARSFSSGNANHLYNWGTGLIPSDYRPSHQVTGVIDQLGTCYVDENGNFKGRFTNAITSSTACKMTVQWHY